KNPPRPAAENPLAVHVIPLRDAVEDRDLAVVDGTVAANRNAEQEGAVLAHHIDQNPNYLADGFVRMIAPVMPVADAGARLEWLIHEAFGHDALEVERHRAAPLVLQPLRQQHAIQVAAVRSLVGV